MESGEAGPLEESDNRKENSEESPLRFCSSSADLLVPELSDQAQVQEKAVVPGIPELSTGEIIVPRPTDMFQSKEGGIPKPSEVETQPRDGDIPKTSEKAIQPRKGNLEKPLENTIQPREGNSRKPLGKTVQPREGNSPKPLEKTIQPREGNSPKPLEKTIQPKEGKVLEPSELKTQTEEGNVLEPSEQIMKPNEGYVPKPSEKNIHPEESDILKISEQTTHPEEGDISKPLDTLHPKEGDIVKPSEQTTQPEEGDILEPSDTFHLEEGAISKPSEQTTQPEEGDVLQLTEPTVETLEGDMVKVIQGKEDFEAALKDAGERLVAVDFSATWCGPCKAIKPLFHALSVKYDDVMFLEVDADECEELVTYCDVFSVPTFQFYKKEEKVGEFCGAIMDKLEATITELK